MKSRHLWRTILIVSSVVPTFGCASLSDRVASFRQPKKSAEVTVNVARLHEKEGRLAKAKALYEDLYQRDSEDVNVCHRLAIVSARLGEYDASLRYFDEARQLAPNNADIVNDFGYSLFARNDLAGAEAVFRQALALDSRNERAKNNLAVVLGHQGNFTESLALFRQTVSEAEANANLAYIHVQRGEGQPAIDHYSRALSLDPNLNSAAHGLLQIAQLQQRHPMTEPGQLDGQSTETMVAANSVEATPPQASSPVPQQEIAETTPEPRQTIAPIAQAKPAPQPEIAEFTPAPRQVTAPDWDSTAPTDSQTRPTTVSPRQFPATSQQVASQSAASEDSEVVTVSAVARQNREPLIEGLADFERPQVRTAYAEAQQAAPQDSDQWPVIDASKNDRVVADLKPAPVSYAELCPDAQGEIHSLVTTFDGDNPQQWLRSLHRIGRLGPDAESALPAIHALLDHQQPFVRIHAVLALSRVSGDIDEAATAVLIRELQNFEPGIRAFAATALREVEGIPESTVIAALSGALSDSDPAVRLHAAEAIGKYDGWQGEAITTLVSFLNDESADIRMLATYSLGNLTPQSALVISALSASLHDRDSRVRAGAAFALGEIGPSAISAVPQLERARRDSREDVRDAAMHALRRIANEGGQGPRA